MIVSISRDEYSYFLTPHSSGEAWWLSPGAYRYLLQHGYKVYEMERVSKYLVERMKAARHLRPLSEAPSLGSFDEDLVL